MDDEDVHAALVAASLLIDSYRLRGALPPAWIVRHRNRIRAIVAACGTGFVGMRCAGAPSGNEHALDTRQAAELMGKSPRWTRLHAASLGGRKVGRDWIIDRRAALAYLEGQHD